MPEADGMHDAIEAFWTPSWRQTSDYVKLGCLDTSLPFDENEALYIPKPDPDGEFSS